MSEQGRLRQTSWMSSRTSQRICSPPEPVEVGEGALDDPGVGAEDGSV